MSRKLSKRADRNALSVQPLAPRDDLVRATHRHRRFRHQPSDDFNDQPFGPARIEAEDGLQARVS